MAQSVMEQAGPQPAQQSRYTSIHTPQALHGLVTNRYALADPSTFITQRFYGGYQDCLFGGSNIEVSPRNTWVRRPGNSSFTTATFPTPPLTATSFNLNGTFTNYIDTAGAIYSVTPTTKTSVFSKAAGASQTSFLQLGNTMFFADGVDAQKIIAGTVWNWGITGPTAAPTINIVESGSAAVPWTPSVEYTTMGLLVDLNGNVQQLISVNADGSNLNGTIGTSGDGGPGFSGIAPGSTLSDGTVTWTNKGPIVAWSANTVYNNATVGGTLANPCIIYDPTSQSCYIQDNPGNAQGTSGSSKPTFTGAFASIVHDGTVKWFCMGTPKAPPLWKASTHYQDVSNNVGSGATVYPVTCAAAGIGGANPQQVFWFDAGFTGGTSGSGGTAPFQSGQSLGTLTYDNQLSWLNLGSSSWVQNTPYSAWSQGTNFLFSVVEDQNNNLQVCITTGVSGSMKPGTSFTLSAASNASAGNTTYTGTFSPTIATGATVTIAGFVTNAVNNGTFTVVSCSSTMLVVNNAAGVAESHSSTATFNPWGTSYGQNTVDGTGSSAVTWTCVGKTLAWAASTKWYLPLSGFVPPQATDPYGGSEVIDSNGNVQIAVNNGKSGSSAPTWATAAGSQTQDPASTGTLFWINSGVYSQASLSWSNGYAWGYAFKARTSTDFYVTNIPNGLTVALGAPTGSADGSISTCSPIFKLPTGPNTGAVVTVSGVGSLDPQVDTIVIFRCTDGFQGGPYLELTEIPAPAPVNGQATAWSFSDTIADVDLDNLIQADTVGLNDPPPAGLTNLCYTQGRIWGSVQNIVYASSGPDIPVDNGNGLTGWAPANDFPLTSPVSATLSLNNGILAFTTTDQWSILGGPAITQFFPSIMRAGVGLLSPNAICRLGAEILLFTADRRLLSFIPGAGETEPGLAIADQFASLDPSKVYLTLYENGLDKGIFLADGSTGWFRLIAHSWPNNDPVWSTFATITGGAGMVLSVQTAPGVRSLLIGGTSNNEAILKRDTTVSQDNGTSFAAYFIVGGIPLTHDGQLAELGFVNFTGPRIGSAPTVAYLLDASSGTFQQFASYQNDPPLIYGDTVTPTADYRNRYNFVQTMSDGNPPNEIWCTDIQLQVTFPTENAANEVARFTIFGGIYKEIYD